MEKALIFGSKINKINFFHIYVEISKNTIKYKVVEHRIFNKISAIKI